MGTFLQWTTCHLYLLSNQGCSPSPLMTAFKWMYFVNVWIGLLVCSVPLVGTVSIQCSSEIRKPICASHMHIIREFIRIIVLTYAQTHIQLYRSCLFFSIVENCKLNCKQVWTTVWHEILAGIYFCGLTSFCVLRELIFAIWTEWFFLLGINFCDFQEVAFKCIDNIFVFIEDLQSKYRF